MTSIIQRSYQHMLDNPGKEFTIAQLAKQLGAKQSGVSRSLTRTFSQNPDSYPGLCQTQDGTHYFVDVQDPEPVASDLGHDIPSDDSDIIEATATPYSPMDDWTPGDQIEVLSVGKYGMVAQSVDQVYFITAQPIEEFVDVAAAMMLEKAEREKSF